MLLAAKLEALDRSKPYFKGFAEIREKLFEYFERISAFTFQCANPLTGERCNIVFVSDFGASTLCC